MSLNFDFLDESQSIEYCCHLLYLTTKLIRGKPTVELSSRKSKAFGETQITKASNMNSSIRFNKVKFLQILGLLSKRFNYQTLKFESYWPFRVWFYLSLFCKIFTIKYVISDYFPQNHVAQLYLGSFFNFLDKDARFFMSK